MSMNIDNLSQLDVFHIAVGLERLRDDNTLEAKRYRDLPSDWEDAALRCEQESEQAELLRLRIQQTPGYHPAYIRLPEGDQPCKHCNGQGRTAYAPGNQRMGCVKCGLTIQDVGDGVATPNGVQAKPR